mmetsp:Transcript_19331/g.39983  ORF Transcript_19331/g.39983 Transcript_19331/m.39983 type:complete len:219 (+) Transcript_19331:1283-1939(+)
MHGALKLPLLRQGGCEGREREAHLPAPRERGHHRREPQQGPRKAQTRPAARRWLRHHQNLQGILRTGASLQAFRYHDLDRPPPEHREEEAQEGRPARRAAPSDGRQHRGSPCRPRHLPELAPVLRWRPRPELQLRQGVRGVQRREGAARLLPFQEEGELARIPRAASRAHVLIHPDEELEPPSQPLGRFCVLPCHGDEEAGRSHRGLPDHLQGSNLRA